MHQGKQAGKEEPHGPVPDEREFVTVDLPADVTIDELVLAFRKDGELHELKAMEPPVYGELRIRD